MPLDEESLRFLNEVWGDKSGYASLPYKDLEQRWHEPKLLKYEGTVENVHLPQGDWYFCPQLFSEPTRKKEFALPTNLLWADLDYAHPAKLKIRPSFAWESSPGRFQAIWILNKEIPAERAAQLSKRIAYAEGADKGGWDVTQVLRIPGSHNHKYDARPTVKLLWANRHAYSVGEIQRSYRRVNGAINGTAKNGAWPDLTEAAVQAAIASLPLGYRRRLVQDAGIADRSRELQLLARDLLRRRIAPELVVHIIQRSTVNKFAGRPNEHEALLKQVADAQAVLEIRKAPKPRPEVGPSPAEAPEEEPVQQMQVHRWADFMAIPTHLQWLVEDAWVDRSVGFISGRSKSYKTWIALDLALSIVSGQPFLDRYPVRRTGPVLLIQEEDPAPVLQERLRLIAKSKDMLPEVEILTEERIRIRYPDYPLHIINLQGFNLGAEEKVDQVRNLIAELNPVAVILDPLIVMLGGTGADENRATEVSMILQAVKMWREEFGCSIIIVHHWNKGKVEEGERFGQHMYGSFVFHAWLESALHVMPIIEEGMERISEVTVEREFKAAPSGRSLRLKFDIDSVDKYTYQVIHSDDRSLSPTQQQIMDQIKEASTTGTTTPELVAVTGHPRTKVVEALHKLVRLKMVQVLEKGGGRGRSTRYGAAGD